jgi:hypothetical protein
MVTLSDEVKYDDFHLKDRASAVSATCLLSHSVPPNVLDVTWRTTTKNTDD